MPLKSKRWCDPKESNDGHRLLICLYRPRALPKAEETWDEWNKKLGPSKELHAAFYGKGGREPISFEEYERQYLEEMKAQEATIQALARRVAAGETITLLCSSACENELKCHRFLLRKLIMDATKAHG